MPGRAYTLDNYRFGFNGKEKDPESVSKGGPVYDYGFRIYHPGLVRFLSVDPLSKKYPWYTPYQFAGNKSIIAIDLDGLEELIKTLARGNYKPVLTAPDYKTAICNAIDNTSTWIYNTGAGLLNAPANVINAVDDNSKTNGGTFYNFVNRTDQSFNQLSTDLINDPKKVANQFKEVASDPATYEVAAQMYLVGSLSSKALTGPTTSEAVESFNGGSYKNLSSEKMVIERNHMPTMDAYLKAGFNIGKGEASAIQMIYEEHRQFISTGSSKAAIAFRGAEAELLSQGKFAEAFDLNADRVLKTYGDKYKNAISEARKVYDDKIAPKLKEQYNAKQ